MPCGSPARAASDIASALTLTTCREEWGHTGQPAARRCKQQGELVEGDSQGGMGTLHYVLRMCIWRLHITL
jgi:hypothetical protein